MLQNVWIIKDTEPIHGFEVTRRLFRYSSLYFFLKSKNLDIKIISSNYDHFKKKFKSIQYNNTPANEDGIYFIKTSKYKKHVSIARLLNQYNTAKNFKRLTTLLDKPDIIVCSIPSIELALKVANYSKNNNIPIIIDIVDLWPDLFKDVMPRLMWWCIFPYVALLRYNLKQIFQITDAISGLTESYIKWAIENYSLNKDFYSKPIFLGFSNTPISNVSNGFNLIFLGTISRQFDFNTLIASAQTLTDVEFNIVGDGDLFEHLKAKSIHLNNVIWHGWKEKDELHILLLNATIAIMPYKNLPHFQKNITNKFSEYLSYGLPILTGVSGEMRDLLEKHNCGEFYSNTEELIQKVLNYKNIPEKLKLHKEHAVKLQRAHFDINKINEEFFTFIEDVHTRYHNDKM